LEGLKNAPPAGIMRFFPSVGDNLFFASSAMPLQKAVPDRKWTMAVTAMIKTGMFVLLQKFIMPPCGPEIKKPNCRLILISATRLFESG
jgi:hypothetical protein